MKNQSVQKVAAYRLCWLALLLSFLIIVGHAPRVVSQLTHDPSSDPFPILDYGNTAKAVVVGLNFTDPTHIDPESVIVDIVPGPARGRAGQPPLLNVELLGLNGELLEQFNAWHPLWVLTFDAAAGGDELTVLPEGPGYILFDLRADVATVDISDVGTQQKLVSVDLIPDIHDFCRDEPTHPACTNVVNRPPTCHANGPYVAECAGPTTLITLDGTSSTDPDGDPLTYAWSGPFTGGSDGPTRMVKFSGMGSCTVTLTVSDDFGGSSVCNATVTIQDTTPPVIQCNAPTTMVPPDAPISFQATAADVCQGNITPAITGFDCYAFTKKEKRISKTDSCQVTFQGDSLTVGDSGGVGDHIEWTITATDASDNSSEPTKCVVTVLNPGQIP